MKVIKGTKKGFFGNVLDVARHISHALKTKEEWYIDWDNTPYNSIDEGPNAWDYFFINNYQYSNTSNIVSDYTHLELFDNLNFRQTMNILLTRYIQLNKNTQNIINTTRSNLSIDNNTLGIHIRKTDKNIGHLFGEPQSAMPLDISMYIKYIDEILPSYSQLFVASDDIDDLDILVNYVRHHHNKEVKFIDAFRSRGNISIHNNYSHISGYKKGLDVLIDCYMLSSCGHIIRSTSNVGSTAQFINLNLTHTNINQLELGDNREQEYNL